MESSGWAGKTITLKYKLDTYQGKLLLYVHPQQHQLKRYLVFTRARALERWITKKEDLFNVREMDMRSGVLK